MRILFLLLLFISFNCFSADWLCKETASTANGDEFIACGHAESDKLEVARDLSLENAKIEFKKFCEQSINCKDFAVVVSPLRTDCNKIENKYICDRGLQYKILPQKKSSIYVDKSEIEELIKSKEKELSNLKETIHATNKLAQINSEIESIKKIDKDEADLAYLKDHLSSQYKSTKDIKTIPDYGLYFIFEPKKFKFNDGTSKSISLYGIGTNSYLNIYGPLKFKLNISVLINSKTEEEAHNELNSAGINVEKYYGYHILNTDLGIGYKFDDYTIGFSYGYLSYGYNSIKTTLNGLNYTKYSTYSTFLGLNFMIGHKYYFEISPKYELKNKNISTSFSFGFSW